MTKPKTPTSPTNAQPDVQPLDGWKVQTGFGTLQTLDGEKLVRLEDVHIWMCDNGKPPKDAVYDVFSPFYMACLAHAEGGDPAALELPRKLELINATTYPNGVIKEGDLSKVQAVKFYASAFPALGHVRFSDGSIGGLVYSMAEGALRVWQGHADISTDHLEIAKRRRERKTDETYAIQWPSDEDLRKLLGRLAVPISTAYELWKWGSVSNVEPLRSVATVNAEPLATKKIPQRELAPEWGGRRLKQRLGELKRVKVHAPTKALAAECGLPVREVSRRIQAVSGALGAVADQLKQRTKR